MAEVSVESEYFNNPTQEQIDTLNDIISSEGSSKSEESSESITTESSKSAPAVESNKTSVLDEKTESKEEKPISYTNEHDEIVNLSVREWEDDWNKRNVDSQWQNIGRSRDDMYDRYTGLDRNGKKASEEMSSIGVPKSSYLEGLYERDENGKLIHQTQLDAVKEARKSSRDEYLGKAKSLYDNTLGKAVEGAKSLYDNTIGKAVGRISAYRDDISEKARESSDTRKQSYIDDAKLLAKSNLQTSNPERIVTLERDATRLPPMSSSQKSDVLMRVEGIDKSLTQKQIDETKEKLTKDLDFVKSYYEKDPSKALSEFYANTEMSKETGLQGLAYYDKNNMMKSDSGKTIPTGTITTESGHKVDIEIDPKGDLSKDNLKSMVGIGPGREIGTATIYLEDGSTKTYTLHNNARVDDTITIVDENGKDLGYTIYPNTPEAFMHNLSYALDEIPGQALNKDSPTVQEAINAYDAFVTEKNEQITNLENAKVDEEHLAGEWEKAVESSNPTAIVSEKGGGNKELINTTGALEKTMNQFTNPADKEAATNWYNTYTPQIEEAMKRADEDPVGKAGELAKVLDEAKAALAPYANENFTNFNTAVNDYVGAVAGTYFINTQLYDRGITADNSKENIIDRLTTAYNSDKMSFGQKVLYTMGVGSKEKETDKGVMQLRGIAEQSLGRTSELSDNFKGAVMSSLMAQSIDNKSTVGRAIKDTLATAGVVAANALSGFNPIVVGVSSLYAAYKSGERLLQETTEWERNKDNQERLESIKAGTDQKAMPATVKEDIYNSATRGTGQDIKHVSEGVTNLVFGIVTGEAALIADGVYELMQVNSLNKEVKEFVDEEDLKSLEQIKTNSSEVNEEDFDEKKKRSIDELEEVTSEGSKQDSLSGINLPDLSDEDLEWLIRRPEMKNYEYK